MRLHPTCPRGRIVSFFLLFLILILSCSKDSDLLNDAIFNDATQSIEERESKKEEVTDEPETVAEQIIEESSEAGEEPELVINSDELAEGFENRTTRFPTVHDAHFQSGKGYNQHIIRLEEGHRTSYLMFDLSQIASIDGQITEAKLEFTINSDDGDGTIKVYKGQSSDWTESDLTSAPEIGAELGSVIKQYKIGATEEIDLQVENLAPELSTLILDHEDGNDLAFASKEHPSVDGPQLVVSYYAPEDAEDISVSEDAIETSEEEENGGPMAVADGSPSVGTAPLEVAFSGSNSSGDSEIQTYSWDFKDGTTSTTPNPTHTFAEPGTYEVILEVTDADGQVNTDMVTITVNSEDNEAPKAIVSATPTSGTAPLEVQFKGSDSSDDNGISSYKWEFKDGSTATNANPEHTFEEPGEYDVKLTVTDENGLSNSKTIKITVEGEENEAPKAIATATPTSGVAPLEVQFKGSDSTDDTDIVSYSWDFKDGSNKATNANPSHTFAEAGEYKVVLTVKDAEGLQNSKSVTINVTEPVQNEPPKAIATATPTSGDAPLEVQFKGSSSTDDDTIVSYKWDFKNGSTSSSKNPTRTFNEPGTYNVTLTVRDNDGEEDTEEIVITVNAASGSSGGSNGDYPSHAVFASDYGFNSNDATSAFEAAINSGKSFVVIDKQSSDWIIKPTNFFDLNGMTIVFESGVVVRAKSGAFPNNNDELFHLFRPKNLVIKGYGATLRMNKSEYTSGEHRHTLGINKGENITIQGLTFRDSGGDGIFLAGDGNGGGRSTNITIEDVTCTNNRRNGMSIISARNVWVRNSEFTQSNGRNPETGVDLEPNFANEELVNINFIGCKFSGNDSAGFQVSPHLMTGSSSPISVKVTNCTFSYNSKSPNGKPNTEILMNQGHKSNPVQGEIKFENVKFNGSQHRVLFSKKRANEYRVVFKNCDAIDVAKSGGSAPIELQRDSQSNTLGNFIFDDFYLEYSKNKPFMEILAPSSGFTVKDIQGSFTIKEPYDNPLKYTNGYNPSKNVNVNINYNHIN